MMKETKVRVLRFLAPKVVKISNGIVKDGLLYVDDRVYLLVNPNTGEIITPLIVDRGVFGKELLYIVNDLNVFPYLIRVAKDKSEISINEFLNSLDIDENTKKKIIENAEKIVGYGYVVDFDSIKFEWSEETPKFVSSLIESNFASFISKESKKEEKKFNVKDFIVMFIVLIIGIIIMFSLMR
ncbi:MAG: hypothetical protein QXW35_02840 [Candidatus Aenigmatarchaeota archaeon]